MNRDQCKWYWKGFDDAKAKLEQRSVSEHLEPVATVVESQYEHGSPAGNLLEWSGRNEANDLPVGTKLYTTPYVATPRPQRTWEGLSVFEINDLVTNTEHGLHELVERTEKLLKEKNT